MAVNISFCMNGINTNEALVEKYPSGHPRLSRFMASDSAYMSFRGFGTLHMRLILHKGDQLRALEQDLNEMDRRDAMTEETRNYLRSRALDENRTVGTLGPDERSRSDLLNEIQTKLMEYGKLASAYLFKIGLD